MGWLLDSVCSSYLTLPYSITAELASADRGISAQEVYIGFTLLYRWTRYCKLWSYRAALFGYRQQFLLISLI